LASLLCAAGSTNPVHPQRLQRNGIGQTRLRVPLRSQGPRVSSKFAIAVATALNAFCLSELFKRHLLTHLRIASGVSVSGGAPHRCLRGMPRLSQRSRRLWIALTSYSPTLWHAVVQSAYVLDTTTAARSSLMRLSQRAIRSLSVKGVGSTRKRRRRDDGACAWGAPGIVVMCCCPWHVAVLLLLVKIGVAILQVATSSPQSRADHAIARGRSRQFQSTLIHRATGAKKRRPKRTAFLARSHFHFVVTPKLPL
jgi:hypothetical protein